MSHLEEGQLHALLDGELSATEQRAVEAHLAACAECRARLDEARAFLIEADQVISEIGLPPASRPASVPTVPTMMSPQVTDAASTRARRFPSRALAWAASLLLAVGLGYAGSTWRLQRQAKDAPAAAESAPAIAQATPAPHVNEAPAASGADATPRMGIDHARERPAPSAPGGARSGKALGGARAAEPATSAPAPAPPMARPAPSLAMAEPHEVKPDQRLDAASAAPAPAAPSLAQDNAPLAAGKTERKAAEAVATPQPGSTLADARRSVLPVSGLRRVEMASAVKMLGGTIRLVDGLTPTMVLAGPGAAIAGADPGADLVRVVYEDPPGRELWLDQQRLPDGESTGRQPTPARNATTLLPGDTLLVAAADGARSLRWLDRGGFRLGLTGHLSADSLRAITRRVQ